METSLHTKYGVFNGVDSTLFHPINEWLKVYNNPFHNEVPTNEGPGRPDGMYPVRPRVPDYFGSLSQCHELHSSEVVRDFLPCVTLLYPSRECNRHRSSLLFSDL